MPDNIHITSSCVIDHCTIFKDGVLIYENKGSDVAQIGENYGKWKKTV